MRRLPTCSATPPPASCAPHGMRRISASSPMVVWFSSPDNWIKRKPASAPTAASPIRRTPPRRRAPRSEGAPESATETSKRLPLHRIVSRPPQKRRFRPWPDTIEVGAFAPSAAISAGIVEGVLRALSVLPPVRFAPAEGRLGDLIPLEGAAPKMIPAGSEAENRRVTRPVGSLTRLATIRPLRTQPLANARNRGK